MKPIGTFAVGGPWRPYTAFPGLVVEGVGQIAFPLVPAQVEELTKRGKSEEDREGALVSEPSG